MIQCLHFPPRAFPVILDIVRIFSFGQLVGAAVCVRLLPNDSIKFHHHHISTAFLNLRFAFAFPFGGAGSTTNEDPLFFITWHFVMLMESIFQKAPKENFH